MNFRLNIGEQSILCKELKVSLYKDLLKSTYGDDPDAEAFLDVVANLLSSISDAPCKFFKELSVIDLMSCLFQLRINSLGNSTIINLNIDEKKRSLELRLDLVNEELIKFNESNIKKTLDIGSVKICLEAPSVQRLLEKTEEEFLYFVKSVSLNNKTVEVKTNKEAKEITEKLPIKATLSIVDYFENVILQTRSLNFLARYGINDPSLGFVPSIDSLIWFTKLMFNESLESLYDNLFYLAKLANIPPSYTEKCSVGEYHVFTNTLRRTLSQESGSNEQRADSVPDQDSNFSDE